MRDNDKDGQDDGQAADKLFAAGADAFRRGEFDEAADLLERYLNDRPGDAAAAHILARALLQLNRDLGRAEERLRQAIAHDPGTESVYLETLGALYIHMGEHAKAVDTLELALVRDTGSDPRHTESLKYYHSLASKKAGTAPGNPDEPPFLKVELARLRGRRRQTLFLFPSILVHVLILTLVWFLANYTPSLKQESKEDLTYVDVAQERVSPPVEGAPEEAAPEPGVAPEKAPSTEATPAPVTARKEIPVNAPERGLSKATGPTVKAESARGERGATGGKAKASIEAAGSEGRVPGSTPTGEKGIEVGSLRGKGGQGLGDEVALLTPSSLNAGGQDRKGKGKGSGKSERLGSVERGGGAAGASRAGMGLGEAAGGGPGAGPGGAKKKAEMGGAGQGGGGQEGPARFGGGSERGLDIPSMRGGGGLGGLDASLTRRELGIPVAPGAGGGVGGASGKGGERLASVERGSGGPASGAGRGVGFGPGGQGQGYAAGGASGKGSTAGKLDTESSGGGVGGFLGRVGDKVSDMLGGGSSRKGTGGAEADLNRGSGLQGLLGDKAAPGRGAGPSGKGGVQRLSSVERGTGGPAVGGSQAPDASGGKGALAGGVKKEAAGALGAPAGTGADRYASAGGREARPGLTERNVGPGKGKGLAGNLGPRVTIVTPTTGRTRRLTQVVKGTVSNRGTKKAVLTVNTDSRVISVDNGSFESVVALGKGRNTVSVMAFDQDGNVGKDTITLDYDTPTSGSPIVITTPKDGQVFDVSEMSVIAVKGTIGDQDIKRAKLIINGNPTDIVVNRGYFQQGVALVQERDTLVVEAVSADGEVSRSEQVQVSTTNARPKDIMVILTWDKPHADFDLHIYSPLGGHTYYKSPTVYASNEAIAGAQLEQDAKGNFGPEVFTQAKAEKGVYTLKSNYFYSGGDGDAHATATVILYGDNPSRRMVRVFGPHLQVDTKSGEDIWQIARFRMPEGIFIEE